MTSDDFLNNDELVKSWRDELTKNDLLKIVLQICDDEGPLSDDAAATEQSHALVHYGEIRGYARYSKKIQDLSKLKHKPVMIRTTYGVKDAN